MNKEQLENRECALELAYADACSEKIVTHFEQSKIFRFAFERAWDFGIKFATTEAKEEAEREAVSFARLLEEIMEFQDRDDSLTLTPLQMLTHINNSILRHHKLWQESKSKKPGQ